MKTLQTVILGLAMFIGGCNKLNNSQSQKDVIYGLILDKDSLLADGSSQLHIQCSLDSMATTDQRNILFKTDSGKYLPNNDTTAVVPCVYEGRSLIAKTTLQAPQKPGFIVITAQPGSPNPSNNKIVLADTIYAYASVPAKLVLTSDNSGIGSEYSSEVICTALMTNAIGGNVSIGNTTKFEDILDDNSPASGNWRSVSDSTNAASETSAIYSTGVYAVGTRIRIISTVLSADGKKTKIADTLILHVNK